MSDTNQKNHEFELIKNNQPRILVKNKIVGAGVGLIESLYSIGIYTIYIHPFLIKLLERCVRYIMYPLSPIISLLYAGLAWHQVYVNPNKKRNIFTAILETLVAAAISSTVIGALVTAEIFAPLVSPVIFTTTCAKTLFHAGAALYYLKKSVGALPQQKTEYLELAKGHGIGAIAGFITAGVGISVFVFNIYAISAIGIALGLFGIGYAIHSGYNAIKASRELSVTPIIIGETTENAPVINHTKQMYKKIGISDSKNARPLHQLSKATSDFASKNKPQVIEMSIFSRSNALRIVPINVNSTTLSCKSMLA